MKQNDTLTAQEQTISADIIARMKKYLAKKYKGQEMKRFFHPKMHGLVKAEFRVDASLPAEYHVGIFKPGTVYQAFIRFSNAKRTVTKDIKRDFRGFAVKLFPENMESGLPIFQDFILASDTTFEVRNVKVLQRSIKALTGNIFDKLGFAMFHMGSIMKSMRDTKKCSNLLEIQYWSQTPYRFGNKAVKYSVKPSEPGNTPFPANPSDNFLREQLVKDLSEKDFYFDFLVQFYTDAKTTPLDDTKVAWTTPFHKIATIHIPKQIFDTPDQRKLGEDLSFAPWHNQISHEPMGSIDLIRKAVYKALAEFRHEQNEVTAQEVAEEKERVG